MELSKFRDKTSVGGGTVVGVTFPADHLSRLRSPASEQVTNNTFHFFLNSACFCEKGVEAGDSEWTAAHRRHTSVPRRLPSGLHRGNGQVDV